MKRSRVSVSVALLSVLLGVLFAPGSASATYRPYAACRGIEGTLEWDRVGDDYQVRLVIPLPSGLPDRCEGYELDASRTCANGLPCRRNVDGFFGTLVGTVGRLGACDHREAESGYVSRTIYGLHLTGHITMYDARLRRLYGPGHQLELVQWGADRTDQLVIGVAPPILFPGPDPIVGNAGLDGERVDGATLSLFNASATWSLTTRVYGNCPPAGDPKMLSTFNFSSPFGLLP